MRNGRGAIQRFILPNNLSTGVRCADARDKNSARRRHASPRRELILAAQPRLFWKRTLQIEIMTFWSSLFMKRRRCCDAPDDKPQQDPGKKQMKSVSLSLRLGRTKKDSPDTSSSTLDETTSTMSEKAPWRVGKPSVSKMCSWTN